MSMHFNSTPYYFVSKIVQVFLCYPHSMCKPYVLYVPYVVQNYSRLKSWKDIELPCGTPAPFPILEQIIVAAPMVIYPFVSSGCKTRKSALQLGLHSSNPLFQLF
jgi:hypothetical protein